METTTAEFKMKKKTFIAKKADTSDFIPDKKQYAKPTIGLCVTCNKVDDCSYLQMNNAPRFYCEGFDDFIPQKKEAFRTTTLEMTPVVKGLCATCDVRETCAFPKPAEGVWHCEEYV
jgi:hypothetical protein